MKKLGLLLWMVFAIFTASTAQTNAKHITLNGKVIDGDDKSPIAQATIQLLSLPDSTMTVGNVTNNSGNFSINAKPGKYVMKVSFVGYTNYLRPLQLTSNKPSLNLGTITLTSDAIMLKEAVVVAEAPQVTIKEDTIQYNASAYRTSEGAMLEELVRKLPGAEVSDDGNIKINGKEVKKIMVKGKEFFGGDVKTGLKNLPVDMIENLKTYDKKSDLARITGIDDGEEETVLDLTVKKGMNQGWFGNINLSTGSQNRYSNNAMINYFNDNTQINIIGDANNVNDQGFQGGGGGARWRQNNGLTATKTIGASFAKDSEKLEIGGSARYNYNDNDTKSIGYGERFLKVGSSYTNTNSNQRRKVNSFSGDFRLEWKPDSMTNIIFRPNILYNKNKNNNINYSGTFNSDPFADSKINPNDYLDIDYLKNNPDPLKDIRVNLTNSKSLINSKSTSINATLQINRKLNNKGRNITFRGTFGYNDNTNDQLSESKITYYQFVNDSLQYRNQYLTRPTSSYNYGAQITYSEPIAKSTFLQFSYNLQYRYNTSNNSTYGLGNDWIINESLPSNYTENRIDSLCKEANYKYFNHNFNIGLRFIREKYQLSMGISLQPQHTILSYKKGNYMIDTTRTVFNFAPNIDLRYRFSKVSQLRINYRGRSSQPSMEDLLPVVDNSNPLKISYGNPGLQPSFSHTLNTFFNTYDAENQRGYIFNAMLSATQNAIANKTQYNEKTGGTISSPENINGNWNALGMFGFNTALKNKKFTINSFSDINYSNLVAFQYDEQSLVTSRNRSTNLTINERLNGAYRNNWLEIGLNGSISYSWERNKLRPSFNQEPYTLSYGGNIGISFPWSMSLTTNITNQSRKGNLDPAMNKNELIWNAQIAQSLFKGTTTISFEMYDILKQQSNIIRSMSAEQRSVTEYNSINSYCMVHVIYRLNLFGNKAARQNMKNSRGRFMPGDMPPGAMPGGMPGGMGGRPGGMGGGMGGGRRPF